MDQKYQPESDNICQQGSINSQDMNKRSPLACICTSFGQQSNYGIAWRKWPPRISPHALI